MSRAVVRALCLAVLCLAAAVPAGAQTPPAGCDPSSLAGAWGYTVTGTFFIPGIGPVPVAIVGSHDSDAEGNLVGRQHASLGGTVTEERLTGTVSANGDCTGTMTMEIRNVAGVLLRTALWAVVFDDNQREARALLTSLELPNGTLIPAVATGTARKIFANPVGR